ncbi:hypothetical protein, partial [Listeria monocytogenes]|uniref:hypothetical protein n=1 Tax=Listeria monocytogenes TaxID=1639 RepID=UPI002FDC1500
NTSFRNILSNKNNSSLLLETCNNFNKSQYENDFKSSMKGINTVKNNENAKLLFSKTTGLNQLKVKKLYSKIPLKTTALVDTNIDRNI